MKKYFLIFFGFILLRLFGISTFVENLIGIKEGLLSYIIVIIILLFILSIFYLIYEIFIRSIITLFYQKKLVKDFISKNNSEIKKISSFETLNLKQINNIFCNLLNNATNTSMRSLSQKHLKSPENMIQEISSNLNMKIEILEDPNEIKIMKKFIIFYTDKAIKNTKKYF